MPAVEFWLLHGGIALVGALATWVAVRPLNRALAPAPDCEPRAELAEVLAESA